MIKTHHSRDVLRIGGLTSDNGALAVALLQMLSQERRLCGLLRWDNCKLIEDNHRMRSRVDEQNALIAEMLAYIDRLKREYLIPPYHDESTADDFLRPLLGEGGSDDPA